MTTYNRTVTEKVLETLKNDPALAAFVQSFTRGDMKTSRSLYPFVTVGNVRYKIIPYSSARDTRRYTIDILAGTRSLAPGVAFEGGGSGRKGLTQLCDDIEAVIRNNHFDGVFYRRVTDVKSRPGKGKDASGSVRIATITFVGEKFVCRN